MQTRIKQLPLHLANQIAAGEVVERPASVVKELIENSLDAGATHIDIEIEKGGSQLIKIRDNGKGIHHDDLALALSRHATSKIATIEDLERVLSLGFRGEALASISSVARLTLISRQADSKNAWQITTEGPNPDLTPKPAAHPVGTTIEVRDLFYNTPARRKFLRSESTEFSHINEVIQRLSLCNEAVQFTLTHNQRLVQDYLPAVDTLTAEQRLAKVCGAEFVANAVQVEFAATGLLLTGWLGLPTFSRNQNDLQHFYVNKRMVRDKLVSHAVKKAYHDVLYSNRYPAFVLFFEIDPEAVDVNAHPAKHEVRFRDSRLIYDFIFRRIQQALAEIRPSAAPLAAPAEPPPPLATATPPVPEAESPALPRLGVPDWRSKLAAFSKPQQMGLQVQETLQEYKNLHTPASDLNFQTIARPEISKAEAPAATPVQAELAAPPPLGYALGQLKGIYILAENSAGLVMVDMHAAHERILYERLKAAWQQGNLPVQQLLIPITLRASAQEVEAAQAHQAVLAKMALQLEVMGPELLAIRSVPAVLIETDIAQLVRDTLADLQNYAVSTEVNERINELFASFACHAAARAHYKLTLAQMNAILRQMEHTDHSAQCNHGRPTVKQFNLSELDKLFLRGK